jgi:hypothetical protein
MERLDKREFNEKLLPGLLSGNPTKAEATVKEYFTSDAIFKHPFFMVSGKDEIAHLYSFWARANTSMVPHPGVTEMWVEAVSPFTPSASLAQLPMAETETLSTSVVLDLTYQTVPFLPIHSLFSLRHSARIVVMLHLVRGEDEDGKYRIVRQEDLIQVDSLLSALLPHFLSAPSMKLMRWFMRLSGLFILYVLDTFLVVLRSVFW